MRTCVVTEGDLLIWLYLLLLIIVLSGGLFLLVRVLIKFVEKAGGETIPGYHDAADYISNAGLAPPQWSIKYVERIDRIQEKQTDEEKREVEITRVKKRSTRVFRRRLKQLIKFYRVSSTVIDEVTRDRVVRKLREAYKKWKTQSWDEITGAGSGPYY